MISVLQRIISAVFFHLLHKTQVASCAFRQVIDQLTVDNCMVTVTSQSFADKCTEEEKYYGVKYVREPLSADWRGAWGSSGERALEVAQSHEALVEARLDVEHVLLQEHHLTPLLLAIHGLVFRYLD